MAKLESPSRVTIQWLLGALSDPKRAHIRYRLPPTGLPWQKTREELLEEQRYQWEMNKDPLAPWAAVRLCRRHEIAFPKWIVKYMGVIADKILDLVENPAKRDTPAVISNALGLGYGRHITHWRIQAQDYRLFDRYKSLRLEGVSGSAALMKLATEFPLTVETIRRHLKEFARINATKRPDQLLEIQQQLDLDLEPHSLIAKRGYPDGLTKPNRSAEPFAFSLSGSQISTALDCEQLIIRPRPKPGYVGSAAIDLTVDEKQIVTWPLLPGRSTVVLTRESITFPRASGLYGKLMGSRLLDAFGLQLVLLGTEIHSGYSGHLILQIFNNSDNEVTIYPGMPICQLQVLSQGQQSSGA
jgi:dUTPase